MPAAPPKTPCRHEVRTPSEGVTLQKTVFIGYTDVLAAGSRALLGIDTKQMKIEYDELNIPDLNNLQPAVTRGIEPDPTEKDFLHLQILNHKYEQCSLVIVNTVVPADKCHVVANKIMDMCSRGGTERIFLLSAVPVNLPKSLSSRASNPLFENCRFCEPATMYESLPITTLIHDHFLNTMLQLINVEGIPTSVLIIPATRGRGGRASKEDGSAQAIALFHDTMHRLMRFSFSLDISLSLVYNQLDSNTKENRAMIYA
ncbi:unnamed protein product [Owenia fusiformis]|uniref:Uncharacterized protein n=1 Tax=Owenia fusiformis TaxID=6347 RepID=A0A8S4N451_OWEFU|nr:unnamed protein product [Owenia fusiformis]